MLKRDDEQIIRRFEVDILDKEYLKIPFLKYDEEIIVPHLLKVFGDIERDQAKLRLQGFSEHNIARLLTNLLHAIGHGVRWIHSSDEFHTNREISYYESDKLAIDLLSWAVSYHSISQNFIAWSRGLIAATIDEQNKIVRFMAPARYDHYQLMFNSLQDHEQAQSSPQNSLANDFQPEFEKWFQYIDLTKPPLIGSMDWNQARKSPLLPSYLRSISIIILPECSPETELGGYTLQEYRKFYALLSLNFQFIKWAENLIDKIQEANPFGSNPIQMEIEEAYLFFSEITELSPLVVKAIITDLTFDSGNFHTSLLIQPFIRSRNNLLYILPNFFPMVDANRMLTGALNKGAKKRIYDRLINKIEQQQLTELAELFAKLNVQVVRERRVKVREVVFTPDLIVIDPKTKQIIIVDYKHFLSPLGASDVHYRMKEINKAIKQVCSYMKFIPSSQFVHELIGEDFSYFTHTGIILFNSPMSVPFPDGLDILTTDLYSFKELIASANGNITKMLRQIGSPSKLGLEKDKFNFYDDEIPVADWKVVSSIYATEKIER
jgi:hypothetical protein